MLQQPSEFIMYQKLPLDLNVHSAEVNNLHPDFKDLTLQLQAQRAAATQAFFFDAYSVRATVPSSATTPMVASSIQGMYDLPIHAMYNHPIQAMYDPLRHHHQQQHLQLPQPQQQQHHHHHHHHQQQQHQQHQHPAFVPTAGAALAGSWQQQQQQQQQESRGSWFPNWQEVFHGFVVGEDAQQEKQAMAPSLEAKPPLHQGVIVAPPVAATRAAINAGDTQQPYVQTDAAQGLDPCPLSPPGSHHAATLLPHCTPGAEKECDGNTVTAPPISTIGASVSDAEPQQPRVDSDGAQLIDPNPPLPPSSSSATALLPYTAPEPEKGRENSLVHCIDLKNRQSLPPIDGITCKYTTQSPSWLPQGWITEVQTRRTGTTAGTRDKYYKDLVSGRRFRSRNEVIHFLQTGKGRLRKRRRKKVFASSAFGGHHDLLSHQPHSLAQDSTSSSCLFLAPQPIGFLLGPLVNSHPVQTGPNLASVPGSVEEEIEAPCQSPVVQPTTSSMQAFMLGLKQPIEVRPQKLSVQRKAKTLSPKTCEDKQASRLWQWLQKPATTTEQPQRQDADKLVNDDGKTLEDSGREPRIARRTAQLGKEVEVAQKTIMRLGKEMQATVEKLTQEIQTAQRDMRLEMQTTDVSDGAMSNVVEAAHRLDSAMGNVTQATQNLVMAMGIAVQAAQLSACNSGAASPPKQPQATVTSVVHEVSRPDVAMMHSAPRAYTTQVVERPDRVMGYSMHAAKQPQVAVATGVPEAPGPQVAMAHPATRGSTTQAAERPDLAMGYLMQAHRMPNGMMGYSTEAVQRPDLARGCIAQLVQMPDVTMHYKIPEAHMSGDAMCNPARAFQSPLVVMSSPWTQVTQRTDVATGIVDVSDASPLDMREPNKDMHAYQKAVEMSNQVVDARTGHITDRNFAALNLKLDLSMISPSLSSRQRAKFVQKMKAKHTRGLLVVLGRKLCFKALRKAAVRDKDFEPKEEPVVLNSL